MIFRGWGYEELVEEWNLYIPEYLDDYYSPSTSEYIMLYLNHFMQFESRVSKKAAKDIREYCKLIDEWSEVGESSVWKAISEMKHNRDVIIFFTPLIYLAWT